jgi:putative glutamine amidotransferase
MSVHIAIPEPTSTDSAYNQSSLPSYLAALHSAGVTPVIVPLHERQDRVARLLLGVQGILLPGSGYDVDPERYGETRTPECGEADPARTAVDELLLQDAFNLQKPILAICHGAQTLNVWRNGTLIQNLQTSIDHAPGRTVLDAHSVRIAPGSRLASLHACSGHIQHIAVERHRTGPVSGHDFAPGFNRGESGGVGARDLTAASPATQRLSTHLPSSEVLVNSSHHQAVKTPGDNLLVSAVSSEDGVIEGVELDSAEHFVIGVQWHPERTYTHSAFSRAIFSAFIQAASTWQPRRIEVSVAL